MPKKTDQQIVDQTNELARQFYSAQGYQVRKGYRFDRARHPQEIAMWRMACMASQTLVGTDPDDALAAIED